MGRRKYRDRYIVYCICNQPKPPCPLHPKPVTELSIPELTHAIREHEEETLGLKFVLAQTLEQATQFNKFVDKPQNNKRDET